MGGSAKLITQTNAFYTSSPVVRTLHQLQSETTACLRDTCSFGHSALPEIQEEFFLTIGPGGPASFLGYQCLGASEIYLMYVIKRTCRVAMQRWMGRSLEVVRPPCSSAIKRHLIKAHAVDLSRKNRWWQLDSLNSSAAQAMHRLVEEVACGI